MNYDSNQVTAALSLEDNDGDGMDDGWEQQHGGDLLLGDNSDGDTMDNISEFIADTIPTNGASVFMVSTATIGSPFEISFDSSASRDYALEYTEDLVGGLWTPLTNDVRGAGGTMTFSDDPAASGSDRRAYRLSVSLP
jgi:hypothetical protein